jgi:macrolide-specific efflux system membrane fusion protein
MSVSVDSEPTRQYSWGEPVGPAGNHWVKALFVGGVGVALVLAAVLVAPHFVGGGKGTKSVPALATSAVRSFPVTVAANGTVVPSSQVSVDFTTAGTLTQIDTSVGATVTKGTVLAHIDSTAAQNAVNAANAALAAANAQVAADSGGSNAARLSALQDQVNADNQQVSQAQTAVQQTNTADQTAISNDQAQLTADQSRYNSAGCTTSPNSQACLADNSAISADRSRIQSDQQRLQSDSSSGQLRITQAQGQLAQAQATLAQATSGNPSQQAGAQAAVAAATAQLRSAEAQLAATSLVAPTDGTVLEINGQVGENISGGATSAATLPGTNAPVPATPGATTGSSSTPSSSAPLIVLGSNSSMVVGITVPPSSAKKVTAGQGCTITSNSVAGLSLPCQVLAVAPSATLVNGNYVFYVTVTPNSSSSSLTTGLPVSVNINVAQASKVLAVPQSAVYTLGGTPHVDVWAGSKAVPTAVTTGMQGTELVQVTSGLQPGEQVVLGANQGLPASATNATGSNATGNP